MSMHNTTAAATTFAAAIAHPAPATPTFAVLILDTTTGDYVPAIVDGKPFTADRHTAVTFAGRVRRYLDADVAPEGEDLVTVDQVACCVPCLTGRI